MGVIVQDRVLTPGLFPVYSEEEAWSSAEKEPERGLKFVIDADHRIVSETSRVQFDLPAAVKEFHIYDPQGEIYIDVYTGRGQCRKVYVCNSRALNWVHVCVHAVDVEYHVINFPLDTTAYKFWPHDYDENMDDYDVYRKSFHFMYLMCSYLDLWHEDKEYNTDTLLINYNLVKYWNNNEEFHGGTMDAARNRPNANYVGSVKRIIVYNVQSGVLQNKDAILRMKRELRAQTIEISTNPAFDSRVRSELKNEEWAQKIICDYLLMEGCEV